MRSILPVGHAWLPRISVSGGANIDDFWRIEDRHRREAPPLAGFATGGWFDQAVFSSGRRSFMR